MLPSACRIRASFYPSLYRARTGRDPSRQQPTCRQEVELRPLALALLVQGDGLDAAHLGTAARYLRGARGVLAAPSGIGPVRIPRADATAPLGAPASASPALTRARRAARLAVVRLAAQEPAKGRPARQAAPPKPARHAQPPASSTRAASCQGVQPHPGCYTQPTLRRRETSAPRPRSRTRTGGGHDSCRTDQPPNAIEVPSSWR